MADRVEPYVGPRPFEQSDQAMFFGRDREVNELVSLVVAHAEVLLYAVSGAGKTSLINAKLIPLLVRKGFEVLPIARIGVFPRGTAADDAPNPNVFNALTSLAKDAADYEKLVQVSLPGFLGQQEHPRVVIFDQFEELFTFRPERWRDRQGFFEQVRDALEQDRLLQMLFVMREDCIAELTPYVPLLPDELGTQFRLERLRREAALLAVKGPLQNTGRSFAAGVAEELVENLLKVEVKNSAGESVEVAGEFVEPVQLQVVCRRLWEKAVLANRHVITKGFVAASGDVDKALAGFYEESIRAAARKARSKEQDLRRWFEDKLITSDGTRGTFYMGQKEAAEVSDIAVKELESRHLIRMEKRAGGNWYELTHDRFIKPIQEANAAWRAKRRRRWFGIGASVIAILILTLIGALLQQSLAARSPEKTVQDFYRYVTRDDTILEELMMPDALEKLKAGKLAFGCPVGRDQLDRVLVQRVTVGGTDEKPVITVMVQCRFLNGKSSEAQVTWTLEKYDGKWRLKSR